MPEMFDKARLESDISVATVARKNRADVLSYRQSPLRNFAASLIPRAIPNRFVTMSDAAPQIPPELYEYLTNAENVHHVSGAIRTFLDKGDEVTFEYAVAVYLASARFRKEPINKVLQVLTNISESIEGRVQSSPSRLQALIFRGILRAFYGEVTIGGI